MAITIPIVSTSGAQSTVTLAAPVVNATGSLPTAPACISAKAGTATNSVTLNWSDSVFAAGTTNRRYELHEDLYSADHVVTTLTTPTRTSGTLAAASYRYFVIPMDSNGAGPASPKVTVTVPVAALVDSPVGCSGGQPPPPPPGIPALWNASPPAGVCPAPSGPVVGTDTFDQGILAQNEIWDNFNGAAGSNPDSRLWLEDTQNQGGTQTYDTARSFLDGNGNAVLETIQSGGTVFSGRFTGRTKFNMQYGWLAGRIKFANSSGTVGKSWFPAFWLLMINYNLGSTVYGEVDIMEIFGNTSQYSTHLYPAGETLQSTQPVPSGQGGNAANAFHTYWMMWEPERIQIGVDDFSMGTWTRSDLTNQADWAGLQTPRYFITNFAVHPDWLPAPVASDFPARMLVDWIWFKPLALL